jgi:broad specificity phosphatase PhoE
MIHLIRHCETDGNRDHYVGRSDLPLNAKGRAQADALAARLAAFPIRCIMSSPLQRAVQTAHPLAGRLGLPINQAEALIEFDFGDMQNLRKADHALDLRKRHHLVPVPGGESLKEVWDRLLPFAAAIEERCPKEADIALIGHYWSNRMLFGLLSGLSFQQTLQLRTYKPETGTATLVERINNPSATCAVHICAYSDTSS